MPCHQYEHFLRKFLQNPSIFNLNLHPEYEELTQIWGKALDAKALVFPKITENLFLVRRNME